ncbi:serine O-acetyltransferase [Polaromonas sp. CG_9.11]|uniref:serine O-acetyltransferase n=1 Tax=Polaromonas sp. CG_9.11 TaxID=2787730 RepID=UPI0018C95B95|nr:DapH/DapD/GlmU-related protein [Polaromonas sp. CG_9.11]MBG6078130.1 serine O-acetyltransferase [Polaromonas sp. CG_9.11]
MYALKADTFRLFGRFNWLLVAKAMMSNQAFFVVATVRFCQSAQCQSFVWRKILLLPARFLHLFAGFFSGIELPWQTNIRPGLALTHGRGIVVNVNTSIGNNVTLFHGVTLGQRDFIAKDGTRKTNYPVIEDDVWIGPHAIIVGVRVGKGSRIAGGAYVFEDVPPHCVVVGNPGRIVKTDCTPDVVNRWEGVRNSL